jgi:anti-sigma B factor antagonist
MVRMSLEIFQRDREGIIVLDLKGRITAGSEVAAFRSAIERISAMHEPRIVLNLHAIDFIDGSGLRAMAMCQARLQSIRAVARLAYLNRPKLELPLLTKIDTIFEVFDDETEAVNSFFPEREIRRFDILAFVQQLRDECADTATGVLRVEGCRSRTTAP